MMPPCFKNFGLIEIIDKIQLYFRIKLVNKDMNELLRNKWKKISKKTNA